MNAPAWLKPCQITRSFLSQTRKLMSNLFSIKTAEKWRKKIYLNVFHLNTTSVDCTAAATRAIFCLRWWCDFFLIKFVASPARGENHTCSHPRASVAMATAKKSQKQSREKLNELNFSRQNRKLCRSCSHHREPATRQFPEKIASPSQAKNRSCSRGLKRMFTWWSGSHVEPQLSARKIKPRFGLAWACDPMGNQYLVSGQLQKPAIWSRDTGQRIPCFDRCQLTITRMSNKSNVRCQMSNWTQLQGPVVRKPINANPG